MPITRSGLKIEIDSDTFRLYFYAKQSVSQVRRVLWGANSCSFVYPQFADRYTHTGAATARQIAFLSIFYFYLENASIAANAAERAEDYKTHHRRRRFLPAAAAQIAVIIKPISTQSQSLFSVFCRMRQEKQEKLLGRSHRYTLQAHSCRCPIPKTEDRFPRLPKLVMSGWTFSRQICPFGILFCYIIGYFLNFKTHPKRT